MIFYILIGLGLGVMQWFAIRRLKRESYMLGFLAGIKSEASQEAERSES